MRFKNYFLALVLASSGYINAADLVLNDFESGSPTVSDKYGAASSTVANPLQAGLNVTANCGKISRTSSNWYELVYFPASFNAAANTKSYVHILVKYDAQPDISIRVDAASAGGDGSADIRAMNAYSNFGQWQDLVFEINGGTGGKSVIQINYLADLGFNNSPAGRVLNNTDKFAYIDEIIVNSNPLPRGTSYINANNLWDFESATTGNISGVSTYSDANNPVTYPVANPLKNSLNNTDNSCKRVAASTTNWWTGLEYSFTSPVQLDATHKYLHTLVMVPSAGQKVVFDVKVGSSKVISDRVTTVPVANEWVDVVLDLSAYPFISGAAVKCGHWDGTVAGDYFVDEIYLDDNPNPRVAVATALNGLKNAKMIYSQGKDIVIDPVIACEAQIFELSGKLVWKQEINQRVGIRMNQSGIYIVKTGNDVSRIIVN